MAGPTLDDFTNVVCPISQPYKCPPYAGCYGYDSYCDPKSHTVESCFPHKLVTNESKLAFCHDVQQNVSKLLHSSCRYACSTLFPERPNISTVCESHSDVWTWLYATVAVIILLVFVILWLCMPCKSYKKKICESVTFKCLKSQARTDGYDPAAVTEEHEKLVQIRVVNGENMSEDKNVSRDSDVDVGAATQLQSQIHSLHQQPNQTQQPGNTNGSPPLHQPPLTNSVDEVPQSCPPSVNDSAMSSPTSPSPSSSSVGTNDDSGLSSGRVGHSDPFNLVQQTSQSLVLRNPNGNNNQQSNDERRADIQFCTNASIPDQKGELVTNLSQYKTG